MIAARRKTFQMTRGAVPSRHGSRDRPVQRVRASVVRTGFLAAFLVIGAQVAVLAAKHSGRMVIAGSAPVAGSIARPDLIDRNGRLMATDVAVPSLYADPSIVLSRDDVAERLATALAGLDPQTVRGQLQDRSRRFVWLRRHLSPAAAQRVHDLGLPGLGFRDELARAYPLERLAGHVLGAVDIDNKGIAGLERYVDVLLQPEPVHGATRSDRAPVRLTLDVGVQHAVEAELVAAMSRFGAKAAAGLVMDVRSGEMLATVSLPGVDPGRPAEALQRDRLDHVQGATYELGSIFKTVTLAMAVERGQTLDAMLDVTKPLQAGDFVIEDKHRWQRPITVGEMFARSSNVGAGLLALSVTPDTQKAFLSKLGLLAPIRTEVGPVAPPQVPKTFGKAEQVAAAYGHGLAVSPLQAASTLGALINGGIRILPTYIRRADVAGRGTDRVISAEASATVREAFRLCVTHSLGTCRRADVPGYDVGGKTGTANVAEKGGYSDKNVISSFVAAFPMRAPRYLVLVTLFEPQPVDDAGGHVTADRNAAPTAGLVIRRIAPLLGVLPDVAS